MNNAERKLYCLLMPAKIATSGSGHDLPAEIAGSSMFRGGGVLTGTEATAPFCDAHESMKVKQMQNVCFDQTAPVTTLGGVQKSRTCSKVSKRRTQRVCHRWYRQL